MYYLKTASVQDAGKWLMVMLTDGTQLKIGKDMMSIMSNFSAHVDSGYGSLLSTLHNLSHRSNIAYETSEVVSFNLDQSKATVITSTDVYEISRSSFDRLCKIAATGKSFLPEDSGCSSCIKHHPRK